MSFSDAITCLDCKASDVYIYIYILISAEHRWNDTDSVMPLTPENPSTWIRTWPSDFAHDKFHMDRTGIEHGPSPLEAAD